MTKENYLKCLLHFVTPWSIYWSSGLLPMLKANKRFTSTLSHLLDILRTKRDITTVSSHPGNQGYPQLLQHWSSIYTPHWSIYRYLLQKRVSGLSQPAIDGTYYRIWKVTDNTIQDGIFLIISQRYHWDLTKDMHLQVTVRQPFGDTGNAGMMDWIRSIY